MSTHTFVLVSETNNIEHESLPIGSPISEDSDGDGIPDDEDLIDDGNAVLIFSIDYCEIDQNADVWSDGDPYFKVFFDLDNNGSFNSEEQWKSKMFENVVVVDDEGFDDLGAWWIEIGIEDDIDELYFWIYAYDDDNDGNYEVADINPNASRTSVDFIYEISESNDNPDRYYLDGSEDGQSEIDAYIEFSFRLRKGVTIEEISPSSGVISMNEGETTSLSIVDPFIPYYLPDTFTYLWLFNNISSSDWIPINDTDSNNQTFELFANYGSAGTYFIGCIMYFESSRYNYWYYDICFWEVTIIHNNSVPVASITIDSDYLHQFEDISFSGRNSFDLDGDELNYTWDFGDGSIGYGVDVTHVYTIPDEYFVKLTVEDDELATDIKLRPVTIEPIDLSAAEHWGTISNGSTVTLNTDYNNFNVDMVSESVLMPLPFGYTLSIRTGFKSTMLLEHTGRCTYRLEINEDKRDVEFEIQLLNKTDYYEIWYRPSLQFTISIIDSNEQETELWSNETSIPLMNNNQGLDNDGEPLISIPTLSHGSVDIYTWDQMKRIYKSNGTIYNHIGSINLGTIPVNIAQVDIFQFIKALTGSNPITNTIINIGNFFTNVYIESDLLLDTQIQDRLGFYIQSTGDSNLENDFVWCDSISSHPSFTVSGSKTDSKFYGIMKTKSEASLSLGVYFHLNLTESGKTAYGFYSTIQDKGLIIGLLDTLLEVIETGSLPKKDFVIREPLWESGEIQSLQDSTVWYWDYLDYSHEFINHAPVITVSSPSEAVYELNDTILLDWDSSDEDGDTIAYEVYLDTNENPTTIVAQGSSIDSYETTDLEPGTYYWKVVADDGESRTESEIYSFQIQGESANKDKSSGTPGFGIITVALAMSLLVIVQRRKFRNR